MLKYSILLGQLICSGTKKNNHSLLCVIIKLSENFSFLAQPLLVEKIKIKIWTQHMA